MSRKNSSVLRPERDTGYLASWIIHRREAPSRILHPASVRSTINRREAPSRILHPVSYTTTASYLDYDEQNK